MTKRCKHENGYLTEFVEVLICFDVAAGVKAQKADISPGDIQGYLFHCNACGREWRWKAFPRPLWLRKIADQLRGVGRKGREGRM